MFKNGKKIISMMLLGTLICGGVVANAVESNHNEVTGQVSYVITFTREEAELYKASIADTMNLVKENYREAISNTEDKDKIEYYKKEIEKIDNKNLDELFELQSNGMYQLKVPHMNAEIYIDGKEYRTNKEGTYSFETTQDIENEKQEVVLSAENEEIAAIDVDFNLDEKTNDIEVVQTFEEFSKGIAEMADNMNTGEAQVTQVFYSKKSVGSYLGNGAGKSRVFKDTNIVGCNKHDKNTDSINTVQFALQNSDCSQSVKIGVAFPTDYPMSVYCVREAVSNIDGKGNVYCNGTSKMANGTSKGSHINCSWFKGIGHSESFHTHKY